MDISHFLSRTPPFSSLNRSELENVVSESKDRRFKKDKIIYREGELPLSVFVIVEGAVALVRGSEIVDRVSNGQLFPAIFAFLETPIPGIIKAEEPCLCVEIPTETLKRLIKANRKFSELYTEIFDRRVSSAYGLTREWVDPTFEKYLAVSRISHLVPRDPVTCDSGASMKEALHMMNRTK